MNRVLNYIDTHLDQTLDGAELADVANFSRFHFHRIFSAWMGETLGSYVRRRRLEKAVFLLSCGDKKSVLETALVTGFSSGEAFARAFKLRFGCTPSEWRASTSLRVVTQRTAIGSRPSKGDSNPNQVYSNVDQMWKSTLRDYDVSYQPTRETTMDVRIIDLPEVRVAYHRLIGPYGPAIGEFWRRTIAPWMLSHGLVTETCYGVGYDDPSITPTSKCRYDACVEIPASFDDKGRADIQVLPGGRYAVSSFKGKTEKIADAWMWLMREWLPASGLQCDDRPCFEMFSMATAINPDTGEFSCDICIPVREL